MKVKFKKPYSLISGKETKPGYEMRFTKDKAEELIKKGVAEAAETTEKEVQAVSAKQPAK